jgi:two-component system, NarL family, invasion response regulator UvrY
MTVRVVIADDHAVVRAGLRHLIAGEPGLEVVGEVGDGNALLSTLAVTPADVLLLDVTMPAAPFPGLLHEVKVRHPTLHVLVLTMQPEDQFGVRALREGAAGYLTKQRSPEELIEAVRTVMHGRKYVPASLGQLVAAALARGPSSATEDLSDREREVVGLIVAGKTMGEIAIDLALSPKTISTYRTRILGKLGLKTTAQLIRHLVLHQV